MKQLPWPIRSMNAVGRCLLGGRPVPSLEPEELLTKATRLTGLTDFLPDEDFNQGLAVLCASIEHDVKPTLLGRIALQQMIVRILCNRLLWIYWRNTAPQRFAGALLPPLIVIGLPRSGTTFLHRLLALDPAARAPMLWELQRPFPALGHDRRRQQTQREIGMIHWLAGHLDTMHVTSADAVEECMLLLDTTMVSLSFWVMSPVYSYLDWWLARDKTHAYRIYLEHLLWLQSQTPQARLTLKAPAHTGCLDALLAAIPDAMIVQTHRDPAAALTSANSLISSIQRMATDAVDLPRMAEINVSMLLQLHQNSMETRKQIGQERIVDVHYDAFVNDPIGMIQNIYRHFNLEFTADYADRLQVALNNDGHTKRDRHRYHAEAYGQTDSELRQRYARIR